MLFIRNLKSLKDKMFQHFIILTFLFVKNLAFNSPEHAGCLDLNPWGPSYRQSTPVPFYVSTFKVVLSNT